MNKTCNFTFFPRDSAKIASLAAVAAAPAEVNAFSFFRLIVEKSREINGHRPWDKGGNCMMFCLLRHITKQSLGQNVPFCQIKHGNCQNLQRLPYFHLDLIQNPGEAMIAERKSRFPMETGVLSKKECKERVQMSSNNNRINVPQAKQAMEQFKMQAASDHGVTATYRTPALLRCRNPKSIKNQRYAHLAGRQCRQTIRYERWW